MYFAGADFQELSVVSGAVAVFATPAAFVALAAFAALVVVGALVVFAVPAVFEALVALGPPVVFEELAVFAILAAVLVPVSVVG